MFVKGFDFGDVNIEFFYRKGFFEFVDWVEKIFDEFYFYVRMFVDFVIDYKGECFEVDFLGGEKRLFD